MRIGLDPEVAIINEKSGKAMSAHKFINKKEVYTFFRDGQKSGGMKGSEAERDGAALEIRSIVPSACRDNIIPYVAEALRQQQLKLKEKFPGFTLSSQPIYEIKKSDLKGAPEDVFEFGCRPDLDAYTLNTKDPQCPEGDMRRYTGGHIHLSAMGAQRDIEKQAAWAIIFDYFVALPMVAILGERFADGEAERRQFYGQPGSFRFDDSMDKIEFRTLSGRLLLHPTLMYWALGAMKTFRTKIHNPKEFLEKTLIPYADPSLVFNTILNHDVGTAERIGMDVFKQLPNYQETDAVWRNPMGGGGGGTTNSYFYEKAFEVFVTGNNNGITFQDDMTWNWGLYEDYMPRHHSYWGIQQAMAKSLDDNIFPYNEVLDSIAPKDTLQTKASYTHPTAGGSMKYVTPGAVSWLQ